MSKLQTYVMKEVVRAFFPAFLILLAVMMLGFGVRLLQEGLDLVRLSRFPLYITAYCIPWVLPSSMLAAVIMAFGRLSADKELLAMQVEGMHPGHIIHPIYALALVVSLVAALFHFEAAPHARHRIEHMQSEAIIQVVRDRILYSAGRRFRVSPYMVTYDHYRNGRLDNVKILQYGRERALTAVVSARTGALVQPPDRPNVLELVLEDCTITQLSAGELGGPRTVLATRSTFPMRVGSVPDESDKDIKHMSFREMRSRRRSIRRELQQHREIHSNPDEQSRAINERLRPLRAHHGELQRVLERTQNRLAGIRRDMDNDARRIDSKREQIRRWTSDIELLREQDVDCVQTLEQLMADDASEEQKFQEIAAAQRQLNEIRRQIRDLEAKVNGARKELEDRLAARNVKREQVERLSRDAEGLQREVDNLSGELSELAGVRREVDRQGDLREIDIRFHRRLTLSFAVLMFTILGIPLGMLCRRRSTLVAFGTGFLVMLAVFYPFMVWGQIMAETGLLPVLPAMWTGNMVTLLTGAVLTFASLKRCP